MATALPRRTVALFSVLFFAFVLVCSTSGTAHADGFKYWNYFHVKGGKYAFATTGPSGFKPPNGSIEAYRYGLSSTAAGLAPRTAATTYTIKDLCEGKKATSGQKRVGVLIDYGTAADAANGTTPPKPRGACAVVPTAATGQQVLGAVAKVRVEKQLVCGIDGYPVQGCSVTVKNPPPAAKQKNVAFSLPAAATSGNAKPAAAASGSSDNGGGVPWTLVGVAAAVVVIGGGALALTRRNRAS
jgi:hypothetical protein